MQMEHGSTMMLMPCFKLDCIIPFVVIAYIPNCKRFNIWQGYGMVPSTGRPSFAERPKAGSPEGDDVWVRLEQQLLDQTGDDETPSPSGRGPHDEDQACTLRQLTEEVYVVNADKGVAVLHRPKEQVRLRCPEAQTLQAAVLAQSARRTCECLS
jgi:hypothetical protein